MKVENVPGVHIERWKKVDFGGCDAALEESGVNVIWWIHLALGTDSEWTHLSAVLVFVDGL
jgi:hypothetical protein